MVLGRLKSMFGAGGTPEPIELPFDAPIAPDTPFYVVGDIHGCFDQLEVKLAEIDADRQVHTEMADAPIVFIGDLVDRGPKSAQVLRLLFERQTSDPKGHICVFGNHEQMMFEFIDDPAGKGRRWLRFGGIDTLKSFGIEGVSEASDLEDLVEASMDLETAMGKDMSNWLRELPAIWSTGNVHCVHAGLNPKKPIDAQKRSTMIWGHPAFEHTTRDDDQWVVHGHTIVSQPSAHSGRIATDTGAYLGRSLTAAIVSTKRTCFV